MSSKRQQKKTTGGTNAKPIVGGDLDPACYMIWARMSARKYWWPAYRCEESVHAPKKPAINTGAKEKGASGGAEDETETELVAFYTGRKKAGSTKTQHLMAWVDADADRRKLPGQGRSAAWQRLQRLGKRTQTTLTTCGMQGVVKRIRTRRAPLRYRPRPPPRLRRNPQR